MIHDRLEMAARRHSALELRPATTADADLLREWRNDPGTREASRNTREVTVEGHRAWLDGVLGDDRRHLLIAELAGRPVGQVRFDALPDGGYEISVSVDRRRRGKGLGRALIEAGAAWLWRTAPDASRIVAEVRRGNVASRRAFEATGFRLVGEAEGDFIRLVAERPAG
jgi:RimJ/RimL family protein N-acetyltransferase